MNEILEVEKLRSESMMAVEKERHRGIMEELEFMAKNKITHVVLHRSNK